MPAPDPNKTLTPEVRDYLIQQIHWQTCDTDNPHSLTTQFDRMKEDVAELKNNHKVVLGVATFIGAAITGLVNLWDKLKG